MVSKRSRTWGTSMPTMTWKLALADEAQSTSILEVCIRGADEGLISNGDTQAGCTVVHGGDVLCATEQFEEACCAGCVEVAVSGLCYCAAVLLSSLSGLVLCLAVELGLAAVFFTTGVLKSNFRIMKRKITKYRTVKHRPTPICMR